MLVFLSGTGSSPHPHTPELVSVPQQGHVPEESKIRDFVCHPPPANTRLYCTMIRRDDDNGSGTVGDGVNGVSDGGNGGSCNNTNGAADIDPSDMLNGYVPNYGVAFTLYLEFLGGLIPLLKVSRLTTSPSSDD